MSADRPRLSTLLCPLTPREFLASYWPAKHWAGTGPLARFAGLADVPELQGVRHVLAGRFKDVVAQCRTHDGRWLSVPTRRENALGLYQGGATLYIDALVAGEPSFERWLRDLEAELGLHEGSVKSSVFASPRGVGARTHFDNYEAFVVQVRGSKRWRIAANRHVPFPTESYATGTAISSGLARLSRRSLPRSMPRGATTVVLEPGDVLFLPRGFWHATETLEDSLHIDLMLQIPSWVDLLVGHIRSGLVRHEHWRKPALGVLGKGPLREAACAELERLIEHFEDDLTDLGASSIVEAVSREATRASPASPRPRQRRAPRSR